MPAVGETGIQQLGLQRIQGRGHILEALAIWHQRQFQADALQFLLQQIDAPAVEGDSEHVQVGQDLGHVQGHGFIVHGRAGGGADEALPHPHVIGRAVTLGAVVYALLGRPEERAHLPLAGDLANQHQRRQVGAGGQVEAAIHRAVERLRIAATARPHVRADKGAVEADTLIQQ
ncbi:hypothetical protein D9M68_755940 [compost metagenome]